MDGGSENPGRSGVKQIYESIVDWYVDAFFGDLTDADWLRMFHARLAQNCLILDVGSGPGNFAKYMSHLGARVICCDLALSMIVAARHLAQEVSGAAVMDMQSWCFRAEAFEGILAAYSLMHVPKTEAAPTLRGFRRSLRAGGTLALMVKEGSGSYEMRSASAPSARGLVQLWDIGELITLLEGVGFQVVSRESKTSTSPHEFSYPKCFLLCQC
jgi:SAM-dependent methyltransferase